MLISEPDRVVRTARDVQLYILEACLLTQEALLTNNEELFVSAASRAVFGHAMLPAAVDMEKRNAIKLRECPTCGVEAGKPCQWYRRPICKDVHPSRLGRRS